MDEVATSKDRVMELMKTLNSEGNEGQTLGLIQRNPALVYQNRIAARTSQYL